MACDGCSRLALQATIHLEHFTVHQEAKKNGSRNETPLVFSERKHADLSLLFEGTWLGVTYLHSVRHLECFLLLQFYMQSVFPLQAFVVSLKSTELICHLLPGFDQHHLKKTHPIMSCPYFTYLQVAS